MLSHEKKLSAVYFSTSDKNKARLKDCSRLKHFNKNVLNGNDLHVCMLEMLKYFVLQQSESG